MPEIGFMSLPIQFNNHFNNPKGQQFMKRASRALLCILPGLLTALSSPRLMAKSPDFAIGMDHRARFVAWDNTIDLNADQADPFTFTRHRTRLSLRWNPSKRWEIFTRLTNEFRIYMKPEDQDFTIHELVFDNLYIRWKSAFGINSTLTVGRQDIMLGEGFVVMDGHPMDGSRTIYFNAARWDIQILKNRSLSLFYTYQPVTDDQLPIINDQNQPLIEQPEEAIGVYCQGKQGKTAFDWYVIRKLIKATNDLPVASSVNTAGARFDASITNHLFATMEGAFQFGTFGDFKRSAFGGQGHLDYQIRGTLKTVTLGTIYLSGDDPDSERMEAWDPVFSRWPKWSDSYIYTLIPETGGKVAFWSNLTSLYGSIRIGVMKPLDLLLTLHRLGAPQSNYGGSGNVRGNLIILKALFRLNKNLNGHILWERFCPGSYYPAEADDYNWFRTELMLIL